MFKFLQNTLAPNYETLSFNIVKLHYFRWIRNEVRNSKEVNLVTTMIGIRNCRYSGSTIILNVPYYRKPTVLKTQ